MDTEFGQRPTYAEINLANLAFNFNSAKKFIGENINYMAVVKADAYGHGAVQCAKKLESTGVSWFGVALPEEGLELRANNIKLPILCLGGFWSGQENLLIEKNLTPVLYRLEQAVKFNKAAQNKDVVVNAHLKIDTGMNRIGCRFDEVKHFVEQLKNLQNLNIQGIMTHFAAADNLAENDFTNLQIKRFEEVLKMFAENNIEPVFRDLANSPGAVVHKNSLGNMVRLGGILYGLGGDVLPGGVDKPELKPVMSVHTRLSQIKKVPKGESIGYSRTFVTSRNSLIATIPIGYQDGFVRALSNSGKVIINNRFAPVVGRVSMDWTIVDVTDVPNVKVNDEVLVIGDNGELSITAEELARKTRTISYEITCGINRRVTRQYVGSQEKRFI
ncbi:MAG: alanine racemase [Acidobacteria bacterium]|nr:alanine racemase [Acidobacteriota bacterium]